MRAEKQLLLDEIKEHIDQSQAIVLTKYGRLNPNLASAFRFLMDQVGGSFEVVKKRILIKAAQTAGINIDKAMLEGHVGVVFAKKDPIEVTKALYKFIKENEEIFHVLGGRFEGNLLTAADVEQISKLPSKDEMRAQFLGLLEAPMSQTLAVMEALLTSVIYCLDNKSQSNA